jgi:hypothetical protein
MVKGTIEPAMTGAMGPFGRYWAGHSGPAHPRALSVSAISGAGNGGNPPGSAPPIVDFRQRRRSETRWGAGGRADRGAGVRGELDAYCYGRKLLDRVGWEIYLGGDDRGYERWEKIARVRIAGDKVRITVADGVTYVTGYVDAVRCRPS